MADKLEAAMHGGVTWTDAERAGAARALREAADALPGETEGDEREGTRTWPRSCCRDAYSLAVYEAQEALRDRADAEVSR